ncbi:MerR family transcriptional regulator [Hydrotalea sandarakina]|jgi:DNA-binding transcriptional MerR regulator|uniref:DNA-binding transcriptional MerR regulator n=1 Tax=Hydrotalea sandarakina TaxID=1004304 RepID=A0A2W7RPT8_9BACT|nr:MerR family transcriptional regulator [Hydrotalea sandarakina]PZX62823.1 DNA-binding transcriptional MerR regulator [Hydrotalea sandarakina]
MAAQQLDLFGNPVPENNGKGKVIFANNQIQVKIKQKTAPVSSSVVETTNTTDAQNTEIVSTANALPLVETNKSKRGRKSHKVLLTSAEAIQLPDDATLQQKLYHPIGDVAKWFNVTTSLIRYWENEFDILKPRKTRKGDRLFRFEDIKNIALIYYLLRDKKLSIEGAKQYLKANKNKANEQFELVQLLEKMRSFLLEIKTNLES